MSAAREDVEGREGKPLFVCPGGSTPVSGGLTSEQGKVNGPDSPSRHCVPLQTQSLACDSLLRSLRLPPGPSPGRRAPGDLFSFPYHTLSAPTTKALSVPLGQ